MFSILRDQRKFYLLIHLIFLTKYSIAFLTEKTIDFNQEKNDDAYDEDKLQNIVWMNIFGTYPTLNSEKFTSKISNLTQDYFTNDKTTEIMNHSNDLVKQNIDDKSTELLFPNSEKTLLEIVEDSPLYQLCIRTVNNAETCLALIIKSYNSRKLYADKQHACEKIATLVEFHQCLLQFQTGNNINKLLMPVKKNKKTAETPKRLPFHAWGGKRFNQVGTEKIQTSRVPFNAWGGKRQVEFEQSNNPFGESCEPCKRSKAKFHSWGGKRSKRKTAA